MSNSTPSHSAQHDSASPPAKPGSQQGQHTRTYQACIPCRRRKVRCDLGPVDNPHDPPCVRCRRESKECFFSATRRKRKPQDGGEGFEDEEPADFEVHNGRKRLREDSETPRRPSFVQQPPIPRPLTPGGSVGRLQPLRRPNANQQSSHDDQQQVNNETTAILQSKEVFSGHDALNLLFEAAGRTGDMEHHRSDSNTMHQRTMSTASMTATTPGSQPNLTSPGVNSSQPYPSPAAHSTAEPAIDPAIAQGQPQTEANNQGGFEQAIKAWSRFRFVRAGWFTAREGIAYLDYFYRYLSPLTPIVVPNFEKYESHGILLTEEPMLVVTLLTVASRYMSLSGPGSSSRPYAIHEKLWSYLQGMIDRMIWGQEQFGGGFCGAGAQQSCDVNPLSRKGLRTLGTVESLMLLTEWHPRALHFPPGDDDDELMAPDEETMANMVNGCLSEAVNDQYRGLGGQRIDSWLEPCWRSDRMCWMLLGNALALAYEIGVFDDKSETDFHEENKHLPPTKVEAYYRRKNHLRELLLIYITQTSGRVGLTSMLPRSQRDKTFLKSPDDRLQDRFSMLKRTGKIIREEAGSSPSTERRINSQEMVLYFWMEIAVIMEKGNQDMFSNRRRTRELIRTQEYKKLLAEFQPILQDFRLHLDRYKSIIPKLMHDVLAIEYEYSRVYINSLALQAVVERCVTNTHAAAAAANGANGLGSLPTGTIPPHMLVRWYGDDRHFIREVIDGCRNVLQIVTKGLEPGGYLKHAPVRTFFRIISVTIILLKTFALGATEDDVALSLGLMEEAVSALRNCIVDDVHVGNRFAGMLITLITRIKSRFVRMAGSGSGRNSLQASRATSQSPSLPTAGITSNQHSYNNPMMPPPHAGGQGYNPNSNNGNNPQWPNYSSSGLSGPASPVASNGRATPNSNHPLWGISTETYDPGSNNISIMPPPTFGSPYNSHNQLSNSNGGSADGNSGSNTNNSQFPGFGSDNGDYGGFGNGGADWLALPLDPLLNSYGADVNSNAYGPDVGGYDLLDVLLNGAENIG
ncbi:fungal zn binuclear cluster domain containing protein [Diplodia corticola]|uniref:Fungal zn binuclear cluster domain containing protein n=1 Tax=Diplodia corticola TaxID=236234 RepID=A0A1J9QLR5_9PEZI|nr:fungal zn binuclear cluster domain containing protein [Diplodia corticola]OJD29400.1 fungal zn binuclear cluster domain containing protein [Diplodia corticola]